MKYDETITMSNHQTPPPLSVKQPVGIIKKTAYRPPIMYQQQQQQQQSVSTTTKADTMAPNNESISKADLAVVGVSCNLYRHDFMALKLETRDILIPWNGDQDLLIDRYDCRGYLYDLDPYDADLMSSDERRQSSKQTIEEMEIEHACDLERYMFLKEDDNNEEESLLQSTNSNNDVMAVDDDNDESSQDSSGKRYASIGFTYADTSSSNKSHQHSNDNNQAGKQEPLVQSSNIEKIFIPDESLQLPVGMLVPETVKMNQIVVKTASFVAKQGLQMEILLKTKQAANSQFDFLNFDNHLNPYYKHLIQLIRDNKIDPLVYLAEPATKEDEKKNSKEDREEEEEDNSDEDDDNYLHPLLFKKVEPVVSSTKIETLSSSSPSAKTSEEIKSVEASDANEKETNKETNGKSAQLDENDTFKPSEKTNEKEMSKELKLEIDEPDGVQKTIIDKLAEYVGRNGREFEASIKAKKNDDRFDFLNADHKYHAYYCQMIERTRKMMRENEEEKTNVDTKKENNREQPVVAKKEDKDKKKEDSSKHRKRKTRSRSRSRSNSSNSNGSSSGSESDDDNAKKEKESSSSSKKKKRKKEKSSSSSSHHHRHHKKSSHSHHHHKSAKKSKHKKRSKSRSRDRGRSKDRH